MRSCERIVKAIIGRHPTTDLLASPADITKALGRGEKGEGQSFITPFIIKSQGSGQSGRVNLPNDPLQIQILFQV